MPHLTDRQRAVWIGLASSRTRKQIAVELGLSLKTVEWHCMKLAKNLGITSSDYAAMARMAMRRRLIK